MALGLKVGFDRTVRGAGFPLGGGAITPVDAAPAVGLVFVARLDEAGGAAVIGAGGDAIVFASSTGGELAARVAAFASGMGEWNAVLW
jgi:hypothetical protein